MKINSDSIYSTTQKAPLERLLSKLRCARVGGSASGQRVLDFGCGQHGWNAIRIAEDASLVDGVDASLSTKKTLTQKVTLYPQLSDLPRQDYQLIVALAVFEHIPPFQLVDVLVALDRVSTPDALILGTVPTPSARPVLEFLSFKLGLIDPSQISDHWVYYDDLWLKEIVALSPWRVKSYQRFQFGMNSQFILSKTGAR